MTAGGDDDQEAVRGLYPNDPLALLPLAWLQKRALGVGLAFRETANLKRDEHLTRPTDSFRAFVFGIYRLLKFGVRWRRPITRPDRDVVEHATGKPCISTTINETPDASVVGCWRAVAAYRLENLAGWSRATGRKVDGLVAGPDGACAHVRQLSVGRAQHLMVNWAAWQGRAPECLDLPFHFPTRRLVGGSRPTASARSLAMACPSRRDSCGWIRARWPGMLS